MKCYLLEYLNPSLILPFGSLQISSFWMGRNTEVIQLPLKTEALWVDVHLHWQRMNSVKQKPILFCVMGLAQMSHHPVPPINTIQFCQMCHWGVYPASLTFPKDGAFHNNNPQQNKDILFILFNYYRNEVYDFSHKKGTYHNVKKT